jgi:folate-binding protein YgfZ
MAIATHKNAFMCLRRLPKPTRTHFSTQTPPSPSPPPPPPPASGAAKLTSRRLISLHGPDAPRFLQGIITNNLLKADSTPSRKPLFAAFLTAQGKVLHDVFVYPTIGSQWHEDNYSTDSSSMGYLVEVDATQAPTLLKHLKRHKLRAKLQLRLLDPGELDVWSAWRQEEKWTAHDSNNIDGQKNLMLTDTRATGLGQRILLPSTPKLDSQKALQGLQETELAAYTLRRYLRGVPEGQDEIPYNDVLPMNTNMDLMSGIDFRKGCYLGQELTIRTHHTGVVRRRLLPVILYSNPASSTSTSLPETLTYDPKTTITPPQQNTEIKILGKRGKPGKFIAGVGNVGLAMCRLELMTDLQVTSEASAFSVEDRFVVGVGGEVEGLGEQVGIKAFVPDWMRSQIRAPKVQRRVE